MTVLHLHTFTTRKQKTKTCSSIFIIINKNNLNPRNKERKKVKAAIEFFSFIAMLLLWKTKKQVQNRTFHNISNPKPIFHWAGTFFLSWLCYVQSVHVFGCLYNYKSLGKESKRFFFFVSWEPNNWLWSSFYFLESLLMGWVSLLAACMN